MPLHGPVSGSNTKLNDGTSNLIAGSGVTITSGSGAAVTIAASGGGSSFMTGTFNVPNSGDFVTTASLSIAGGLGFNYAAEDVGGDVFFFVSGTLDSKDTANHGTAVFGGDLVVSGVIYGGYDDETSAPFLELAADTTIVTSKAGTEKVTTGADTIFFVSGAVNSKNSSVKGTSGFGGDVIVSGTAYAMGVSIGDSTVSFPTTTALNVYGNVSSDYVAKIDNDQSSAGHVLKLTTDGNGSGTRFLEMEDGDGDALFRARADGRFGFGATGVSSMGAGTFVVGIDGGHASDIAISKRLQHLGDSDTYMDFPSADEIQFVAGGISMLEMIEESSAGQVLILSGGGATDPDPTELADVNFFVSGTTDSKDGSTKGTAVFGGDMVLSGTLYDASVSGTAGKITSNNLITTQMTYAVMDNDSAASAGSALFFVFDSNGGPYGLLYSANSGGMPSAWSSSGGGMFKIAYNADSASNLSGIQIYFDYDASSDDQRLLANFAAYGGLSMTVLSYTGRVLHIKHDASAASNGVALYHDWNASGGATQRILAVVPDNADGSVKTSSTTAGMVVIG